MLRTTEAIIAENATGEFEEYECRTHSRPWKMKLGGRGKAIGTPPSTKCVLMNEHGIVASGVQLHTSHLVVGGELERAAIKLPSTEPPSAAVCPQC